MLYGSSFQLCILFSQIYSDQLGQVIRLHRNNRHILNLSELGQNLFCIHSSYPMQVRREVCLPLLISGSISTISKSEKGKSTDSYNLGSEITSITFTHIQRPNKTQEGLQLGRSAILLCSLKWEGQIYLVNSINTSTSHSVLVNHPDNRNWKYSNSTERDLSPLLRIKMDLLDISPISSLLKVLIS